MAKDSYPVKWPGSHRPEWADWDHPGSAWNQAAMRSPQADPFCCRTEWQLSFHEAWSPKRNLIIRESNGSVVAFAEAPGRQYPPVLTPIEPYWFFGNPLLGPDSVELLVELIHELENNYYDGRMFPKILISGLRPRGSLYRRILKALGSQFAFPRYRSDVLCGASLKGGLDGYLSRRSSTHRRNLKKQSNRALKKGVSFQRHTPMSDSDVVEIYARMIAVELASWKGIGDCGMSEQPSLQYYECMLRRLAVSGSGRVIFARHEDLDIGFIFGGMAGKIYRGQQFSFDNEWADSSIGNLLQLEQIRWLCEEGAVRYDLGPLMGYKYHWTEKRSNIEARVLCKK